MRPETSVCLGVTVAEANFPDNQNCPSRPCPQAESLWDITSLMQSTQDQRAPHNDPNPSPSFRNSTKKDSHVVFPRLIIIQQSSKFLLATANSNWQNAKCISRRTGLWFTRTVLLHKNRGCVGSSHKNGCTLPATTHYPRPTTTHNVNVRISGIEATALPKLDRYPATDRIPELCIWNSCFSCKYKYKYQIEIEIPIQLYA